MARRAKNEDVGDMPAEAEDDMPTELPPDPPAPFPQVTLVKRAEGGWVGLMHMFDTVRTFIAADLVHARKSVAAVGVSEFKMPQEHADVMADEAVKWHEDDPPAPVVCDDGPVQPPAQPTWNAGPLPNEVAEYDPNAPMEPEDAAAYDAAVASERDRVVLSEEPQDEQDGGSGKGKGRKGSKTDRDGGHG